MVVPQHFSGVTVHKWRTFFSVLLCEGSQETRLIGDIYTHMYMYSLHVGIHIQRERIRETERQILNLKSWLTCLQGLANPKSTGQASRLNIPAGGEVAVLSSKAA